MTLCVQNCIAGSVTNLPNLYSQSPPIPYVLPRIFVNLLHPLGNVLEGAEIGDRVHQ